MFLILHPDWTMAHPSGKFLDSVQLHVPLPLSASARPKVLPAFCPEPLRVQESLPLPPPSVCVLFSVPFSAGGYMPYSQIRSYAGTVHNSETPLQYLCRMTVPDSSFFHRSEAPRRIFPPILRSSAALSIFHIRKDLRKSQTPDP